MASSSLCSSPVDLRFVFSFGLRGCILHEVFPKVLGVVEPELQG